MSNITDHEITLEELEEEEIALELDGYEKWLEAQDEADKIINSLKKSIDMLHSALGESDAVLFRQDLATVLAKWAGRINNSKKAG